MHKPHLFALAAASTLIAITATSVGQSKQVNYRTKGVAPSPRTFNPGAKAEAVDAEGNPLPVPFPEMPSKIVAVYRGPGYFSAELAEKMKAANSMVKNEIPESLPALTPPEGATLIPKQGEPAGVDGVEAAAASNTQVSPAPVTPPVTQQVNPAPVAPVVPSMPKAPVAPALPQQVKVEPVAPAIPDFPKAPLVSAPKLPAQVAPPAVQPQAPQPAADPFVIPQTPAQSPQALPEATRAQAASPVAPPMPPKAFIAPSLPGQPSASKGSSGRSMTPLAPIDMLPSR